MSIYTNRHRFLHFSLCGIIIVKFNVVRRILQDAFAKFDVVLADEGKANTLRRAAYGSIVSAKNMVWKGSEQYTHSGNQAEVFNI